MPSAHAKKARTCEKKWRSASESFFQSLGSLDRSTSPVGQKAERALL